MSGLHLSVKDVMDTVKLLILILKLIAKLRECITYFRSSGGQTVARSNVTGRDGTTNNQMGIELQNTDENSIIGSVEASTSAGNGVHATRPSFPTVRVSGLIPTLGPIYGPKNGL
nr:hypothetical protein CFP56_67275 [Quercus suber]